MAEMPRKIEVVRRGKEPARLVIDGQEFPWYVDASGVRVIVADDYVPGITLTIPAESVQVVDSVEPAVAPEDQQRVVDYLQSKAPPSSWRPKPRQ